MLRGISFAIAPGTTTAIVGATGSGKTTIAALLQRFYEPTEGRILIGETDLARIPRPQLRRAMATVEQEDFQSFT